MKPPGKILVAPLNWGLGHATRCIPVIRAVQQAGAEVIIGADGKPFDLLHKEFPELRCIRLQGATIHYPKNGNLLFSLLVQLPKLLISVWKEHRALQRLIEAEKIVGVISDNRYGLHSRRIKSIFITHQVGIKLPAALRWLEPLLYQINRKLIEQFDSCWIPDYEHSNNLSGELSHKFSLPRNAVFVGPLSRFTFFETEKKYDLLFLLSGPEPQRTLLENLLMRQVKEITDRHSTDEVVSPMKVLLIRGLPEGSPELIDAGSNITQADYLLSNALNMAMLSTVTIICRPGYSSVMDLAILKSKAILIPTPGQTEQEYLAQRLMQLGIYYSECQKDFDLKRALKNAACFTGQINERPSPFTMEVFKNLWLEAEDQKT